MTKKSAKFKKKLAKFSKKIEIAAVQRCTHLVDLEKCCKMSIYLQRSASIQKRTSPPKFGVKNAQLVVGSLLKEGLVLGIFSTVTVLKKTMPLFYPTV